MTTTRRVNLVAGVVLLLSMAGAMATLSAIDRLRPRANRSKRFMCALPRCCADEPRLHRPAGRHLLDPRGAVFRHSASHRFWRFPLLAPLLEVTTELDPKLLPAYQFGANFLAPKPPSGAGLPGAALSLMKYGIEHNPDQWRLYYNLGFLYYTEFKDYAKAADAFCAGSNPSGDQ
jgi:hypothetical protein